MSRPSSQGPQLQKIASANLHNGVLLLEHLTVEELKMRLKRQKLPVSGLKVQLIKRLKLAQLPDEELKALCRSRGIQVGASKAASEAKTKVVSTRRYMIVALEKFPSIVEMACLAKIGAHQDQQDYVEDGTVLAEFEDDFPMAKALAASQQPLSRLSRHSEPAKETWIPGYRATELLSYKTGDYYALESDTSGLLDSQSQATTETTGRIQDWLISKPVSKCLDCKKMLAPKPESGIVKHLAVEHGLGVETNQPDHSALLFKITSFEGIMSLYVWVRPTSTFLELISIVAKRWFGPCQPCNHFATVYATKQGQARPSQVFYSQFHDKVPLGPMFRVSDTLHSHLSEIMSRRPFLFLFGEKHDLTLVHVTFCQQLYIRPSFGQDGRDVDGGILVESLQPEIPCSSCGRVATMTVVSQSGGLGSASRSEFFCGKRCGTKAGYKARLVKLTNSPRCSCCRCASFVYATPDGMTNWEAVKIEEDLEAAKERAEMQDENDIGALDDLEGLEEALDEIILVPAGVDEVVDEPATWQRIGDYDDDQSTSSDDDEDGDEPPALEAQQLSSVAEEQADGGSGSDETLTSVDGDESTVVDSGSEPRSAPGSDSKAQAHMPSATTRIRAWSTPPLSSATSFGDERKSDNNEAKSAYESPQSAEKDATTKSKPVDPPTVIRRPITRLSQITNTADSMADGDLVAVKKPQQQIRLDTMLPSVKTGTGPRKSMFM